MNVVDDRRRRQYCGTACFQNEQQANPDDKKNRRRGSVAPRKNRSDDRSVTTESDALDLESNIFLKKTPKDIAASLKQSAEYSRRRKSSPYRSAMSMLMFYVNRDGKNLPAKDREKLERAKDERRRAFGRA